MWTSGETVIGDLLAQRSGAPKTRIQTTEDVVEAVDVTEKRHVLAGRGLTADGPEDVVQLPEDCLRVA
jgi:hypothetical protein